MVYLIAFVDAYYWASNSDDQSSTSSNILFLEGVGMIYHLSWFDFRVYVESSSGWAILNYVAAQYIIFDKISENTL